MEFDDRAQQQKNLHSYRTFSFCCLVCAALIILSGCDRRQIKQAPISTQELASALGVSSFCADAHFASPLYAQLVAVTTDSTGEHRSKVSSVEPNMDFHLRVLMINDPKSGSLQRISYAIHALNGGGGGEAFVQIEPETTMKRMTTNDLGTFLYDIVLQKGSETKEIHIELKTSATPFPKASPSPSP